MVKVKPKFRAYNTESKVMLDWDEIREPILIEGEIATCLYDVLHGEPEFVAMQYTGLKDKDGTEIYEGDIVVNSGLWLLRSTSKLQYVKKSYGEGEVFVVNLNITGVELRHRIDWNANRKKDFAPNGYNGKPYVDSHDTWNLQKTLEVVGNIYENSELLEESTNDKDNQG